MYYLFNRIRLRRYEFLDRKRCMNGLDQTEAWPALPGLFRPYCPFFA